MKKAELAKHIPKRIGEGSTKLLEVCGEPVLMVTGTRNPSYAGMPNKAAHFTWSKGYLTAWIGNDKSLTWTNEGLRWISITNGEKKKDYEAAAAFLNAMGYGHGLGTMWRYYDVENFEGQMSSQKPWSGSRTGSTALCRSRFHLFRKTSRIRSARWRRM